MKRLIAAVLLLVGTLLGSASAGEIRLFELKDGSLIYGEIVSFNDGVFTIRSESLGAVRIEESKIRAIRLRTSEKQGRDQIQALQKKMLSDEEIVQKILSLQNDPDVQNVLQDPEIMKAVNDGDINALLSNPKFMKLLENPAIQDIGKKVTE